MLNFWFLVFKLLFYNNFRLTEELQIEQSFYISFAQLSIMLTSRIIIVKW